MILQYENTLTFIPNELIIVVVVAVVYYGGGEHSIQ